MITTLFVETVPGYKGLVVSLPRGYKWELISEEDVTDTSGEIICIVKELEFISVTGITDETKRSLRVNKCVICWYQ